MTEAATEKRPETLIAKQTIPTERSEALTAKSTVETERSSDLTATPTVAGPKISILSFVGFDNGPFVITGFGFGETTGTILLGGQPVKATSWRDNRIKGMMSPNTEKGSTEISINGSTFKVNIT